MQCLGCSTPSEEEADVLQSSSPIRCGSMTYRPALKPNDVAPLCRWVCENIKPDHIVIDSLMKCGISPDDYSAQKTLVDQVQSVAHNNPSISISLPMPAKGIQTNRQHDCTTLRARLKSQTWRKTSFPFGVTSRKKIQDGSKTLSRMPCSLLKRSGIVAEKSA